jgi:hypothetical protein
MSNQRPPEGNELAQWLREAGARTTGARTTSATGGNSLSDKPAIENASSRGHRWRSGSGVIKRTTLLALLAACYLQYYYMQVMVEIYSLPTLVVFVPAKRPPST